jgi:MHS family alpha-ketoglutarate permease-like MFS transporter
LVNSAGLSKDEATIAAASALLLYMPLQPLFGVLSEVIGRRPVLIRLGFSASVFTVPLLQAMSQTHDAVTAFLLNFAGPADPQWVHLNPHVG